MSHTRHVTMTIFAATFLRCAPRHPSLLAWHSPPLGPRDHDRPAWYSTPTDWLQCDLDRFGQNRKRWAFGDQARVALRIRFGSAERGPPTLMLYPCLVGLSWRCWRKV